MKFSTLKLIDELIDEAIAVARDEYRMADKLHAEAVDSRSDDREEKRQALVEAKAKYDRVYHAGQDFSSHNFS